MKFHLPSHLAACYTPLGLRAEKPGGLLGPLHLSRCHLAGTLSQNVATQGRQELWGKDYPQKSSSDSSRKASMGHLGCREGRHPTAGNPPAFHPSRVPGGDVGPSPHISPSSGQGAVSRRRRGRWLLTWGAVRLGARSSRQVPAGPSLLLYMHRRSP